MYWRRAHIPRVLTLGSHTASASLGIFLASLTLIPESVGDIAEPAGDCLKDYAWPLIRLPDDGHEESLDSSSDFGLANEPLVTTARRAATIGERYRVCVAPRWGRSAGTVNVED